MKYSAHYATLLMGLVIVIAGRDLVASPGGLIDWNDLNPIAVSIFLIFVVLSLLITWRAAAATKNRSEFYTAGGGISPISNGLAIAGDFMSAATLLGITGLIFFTGVDAMMLCFTVIAGWTLSLIIIAEKLRNLGKYTFIDVVTYRFNNDGLRIILVACSLSVVVFYLIGQLVGAGKLIELLFGLDYTLSVIIVSILMVTYVYFGGMIATTWVQMIKAALLMIGGAVMIILILHKFDFDISALMTTATEKHEKTDAIFAPGGWLGRDPLNVWTVGLTMTFGIMGLPHVLMRFLTVKDAKGARNSVGYATILMALFYLFVLVIGFGAIAILWGDPNYYDAMGEFIGGSNMVALNLSSELGGSYLFGFMSAVAFATILAVVAGLTLSAAAAISHDLYANVLRKGKADPETELGLSRLVTILIGALAIILGVAFENQNVAVVVAIALAIAASVNFPLLLLSMYWRGLTSRGALFGGAITLCVTLSLIILSDSIWVQTLGNETAIFPYIYPTVFSMPLGFVTMALFSITDRSKVALNEQKSFSEQLLRAETGLGREEAAQH